MNKIYRVIYNKETGTYNAVSEYAKAQGKSSSSKGVVGSLSQGIYTAVRFAYTIIMSGVLIATGQVAFGAEVKGSDATNAISSGKNACFYDTATKSVVCGDDTTKSNNTENANPAKAVVMGAGATNDGESSVVLGNGAKVQAWNQTVANSAQPIGTNSPVAAIAIGNLANAQNDGVIALGDGANAVGIRDIVIGKEAGKGATNQQSVGNNIFVGEKAGENTKTTNLIAIGTSAGSGLGENLSGTGYGAHTNIAIGVNANAKPANGGTAFTTNNTIAIGSSALASGSYGVAISTEAKAKGNYSIAQGNKAQAGDTLTDEGAIAIGREAKSKKNAVAQGYKATATGENSLAFGREATADKGQAIAMGLRANTNEDGTTKTAGASSVAIGVRTHAGADNAVAIGNLATTGTAGTGSVAVGASSSAISVNSVAIGQMSEAKGQNSTAIGNDTHAMGKSAVAIGDGAGIQKDASGAFVAHHSGESSTAVGTYTRSAGAGSSAIGVGADASAYRSSSVGAYSTASGASAVAIGDTAQATAENNIAIGKEAKAETNTGAIAIGLATHATGQGAVVVGKNSVGSAQSVVAIGDGAKATADNAVAMGIKANATNTGTIAIGENAGKAHSSGVQGANAVLIGVSAGSESTNNQAQVAVGWEAGKNTLGAFNTATGYQAGQFVNGINNVAMGKGAGSGTSTTQRLTVNDTVALGTNAKATVNDGVALGSGSIANVDKGAVGADPLSAQADKTGSAWTSTHSAVSVGNGTTVTRQITSVSAGTADTDAVNVAQLKASGFKLNATNTGGGEATSVADDKIQNGETLTVDAGKNIKVTHTANQVSIATKDDVSFTSVSVPVAGSNVVINNAGINAGNQKITGVANGENPNDAVNYSQLEAVKNTVGGGLDFAGNTGEFKRQLGQKVTVSGGLDSTKTASNSNIRTVANDGTIDIQLADAPVFTGKVSAKGLDAGGQKITNVLKGDDPNDAVNVQQLQDAITNIHLTTQTEIQSNSPFAYVNGAGEILVREVASDGKVTFKKADGGAVYAGDDITISTLNPKEPQTSTPTTVGNVKAGTKGTDAVNVSQLKGLADTLGGGAGVNDDGTIKQPTYNITTTGGATSPVNTVEGALNALNKEVVKPLTFVGDNNTTKVERKLGTELAIKGGATGTLTDNNIGVTGNATDNSLTVKLAKDINLGATGSLTAGNTTVNNDGVTITNADPTKNVSLTATGLNNGDNKITGVADGAIGEDSKDAINGSQLHATNTNIAKGLNFGANDQSKSADKAINRQLGDTINIKGAMADDTSADKTSGENVITRTDGDTINIELAKDVKFDSAYFKDTGGNETVVAGSGIAIKPAGKTNADIISLNTNGLTMGGQKIKNLADGEVSANSKEGINGSQLFNAQNNIANYLGGGAKMENGQMTAPAYTIKKADGTTAYNTTPANSVGDALTQLNSYVNEGFKILDNAGGEKAKVQPQDQVQFVNGKGTTSTVTQEADGLTKVQYDVAIDDKTIKVDADGKLYADVTDTNSVTKLANGSTTTVTPNANGDETTYTVEVNKAQVNTTPTDTADADKITINTAGKVVKPTNNTKAGNSFVTADVLADVVNNTGFNLQANGDDKSLVKAGDTVQFKDGDNIEITRKGNDITVATKKDVTFNTVTAGTGANQVILGNDGVKVGGQTYINNDGLNANDKKVTNVAPAIISANSKDAVNGSQLFAQGEGVKNIIGGNTTYNPVTGAYENTDIGGTGKKTIDEAIKASKTTVSSADSSIKVTKTTNGTTGADNYDVSVNAQAISENAQLPVVYTKADGTKVYKVGDKFFGNKAGTGTEIPASDVIASMQNADGTISPTTLANVKAGVKDTDAVNVSQLKPLATALGSTVGSDGTVSAPTFTVTKTDGTQYAPVTTVQGALDHIGTEIQKPLTFAGDSGTNVTRKLGTTLNVKGGATGALTDNNIGVVADGTDALTVKLAKDINLGADGSVQTGNTTINNDGVKVGDVALTNTGLTAGDVKVTKDGINAGDKVITGVKAGVNDTDAVNVSQLKAYQADNEKTTTAQAGSDKVTVKGTTTGNNTDYVIDLSASTKDDIAKGVSAKDTVDNKGLTFTGDTGTTGVKKLGDTVAVTGDANISTVATGAGVQVKLNDNIAVKGVTADEAKIGGNVTINNAGINAGNTQITNLKSGLNGKTLDDIKADPNAPERSNAATIGDLATVQNNVTNITNITNNILGGDVVDNTKTTNVKEGDKLGTGDNASVALIDTTNVLKDKDGKPILTTYNVAGQTEYIQNDVIQAINHMNEQGIKFFHVNDGVTKPEDQAKNAIDSSASGAYATAVGYQTSASGEGAVAMGNTYETDTKREGAIVSEVKDAQGALAGYAQRTQATGKNAIAIGTGSQAHAENTIAIGTGNVVTGKNSGAIGDPSIINGANSYSVGNNNNVATNSTFVLGNEVKQTLDNSVILGDSSSAVAVHTTATGGNYTYAGANDANVAGVGSNVVGVVSVGNDNQTRQIQNVSAGVVSASSTDAINGSQLYDTHQAIGNLANYSTNLGNRINEVEDEANAGVSSAMAMASLPQAYLPGKSMLTGGMATYNGEGAVAVGLSKLSDNGRWVLKISGSADTKGNAGGAIGAGFHF